MSFVIRPATEADAGGCGRICYAAFKAVNERHGFPSNFPALEAAVQRVQSCLGHARIFGVVAEAEDLIGFAFLSERDPVRAIGPVAVDPAVQGSGAGRQMLKALLGRASGSAGIRLLQDGYNMHSLALYASAGFEVQEHFVLVEGRPRNSDRLGSGLGIRPMVEDDIAACEALHLGIHGFTRTNELRDALWNGLPMVAVCKGKIKAYTATPSRWFTNHAVAETDDEMQALLLASAANAPEPISFLVPVRRAAFFRWCLDEGFRTIKPMVLMTMGEYREPRGSYIPSVLY
jgi:GNAT superfamily N-acetyltransferase